MVVLGERQHAPFRVVQQAVAVHGDAVGRAQEAERAALCCGLADLGGGDDLERLRDGRHRAARQLGLGLPAGEQLLAAAPARHQPDADLDQADVALGVGLHGGAVQKDLAATAQRHAGRSADDGDGATLRVWLPDT